MQRAYEFSKTGEVWIDGERSNFRFVKDDRDLVVFDHPTTTIIAKATSERQLKGELDAVLDWRRLVDAATTLPLFHNLEGDDDLFADD